MSSEAGFLLDTNVISEVSRPRPAMAWLAENDEERMFLSVATLAEISHGIDVSSLAGGNGACGRGFCTTS